MYEPKTYDEDSKHIEFEYYNNPALCRINGVLHSYCCLCHAYIGNEHDTNWYALIKREYCTACKKKVTAEQDALRHRNFRRRNKETNKLTFQQNALLKQENKLLREAVIALRDDVDRLKQNA